MKLLAIIFLFVANFAGAQIIPRSIEDHVDNLADKIVEHWRDNNDLPWVDTFDPEAPPAGVNPYHSLRQALEQYIEDIQRQRRGLPSRHQRQRDSSPNPSLFDDLVDRCMLCYASREATRDYRELSEDEKDALNDPTISDRDLTDRLTDIAKEAWERVAEREGYRRGWDGKHDHQMPKEPKSDVSCISLSSVPLSGSGGSTGVDGRICGLSCSQAHSLYSHLLGVRKWQCEEHGNCETPGELDAHYLDHFANCCTGGTPVCQ